MPLSPGTRLGSYEIGVEIGAGGMGEVYRATDTSLGRAVAIKVIPEAFAQDQERLERFEREARTLAALNHPNIAIIHGVERAGPIRALVLELVEGPTLADRIDPGPLPLDEALAIADQIALALQAAHELGIVHRDLKPANVKVRDDGAVKVLDFGLAKTMEAPGPSAGWSISPTITTPAQLRQLGGRQPMTELGVILGTAAYMSPEQAKGLPADRRSDIWAFGCVLFEMLAGRHAFARADDTVSDVVAAVLKTDPDWNALPASTPPAVRRLLRRCLGKNPRERLHDIADARLEIADARASDTEAAPAPAARTRLAWGLVAALAALCLILVAVLQRTVNRPETPNSVYRSVILPPAVDPSTAASEARTGLPRFARGLAIAPDGTRVALVAPGSDGRVALWVRPLNGTVAQLIAGTDGAGSPFWSPDGRYLGFVADRQLKKVEATGGPVSTICDGAAQFGSGTWNQDDVILFLGEGRSILRVSASGGAASPVLGGENEYTAPPSFLPDGRRFLYSTATAGDPAMGGIYVGSLQSNERTRLRGDGMLPTYASGFLLFVRDNALMAQRFDAGQLKLGGEPMPVADGIQADGAPSSRARYAVSNTGVLVYQASVSVRSELAWLDRDGKTLSVVSDLQDFSYVQLSPDDRHLAVSRMDERSGNRDIWLYDTTRRGQIRLTDQPTDDFAPAWSPTGDRLAFAARRTGDRLLNLYVKASSGSGDETRLLDQEGLEIPTSWSSDGQFLLFQSQGPFADIYVLHLKESKVVPFANTRFNEGSAQFSPDDRWVAYSSNQTGRSEVYIAPFHGAGRLEPISTDGGDSPRWRRDGRELYYIGRDSTLMAVAIRAGESGIEVGATQPLFRTAFRASTLPYAVSADGRFLVNRAIADLMPQPITLVVNWPTLLKP